MRKPITRVEWNKMSRFVREALRLASSHDPDLLARIEVLERQVERLGAPQYRTLRKGNINIHVERVRKNGTANQKENQV